MNTTPHILIVDDAPTNRLLLHDQLEVLGYSSAEAADGVEALELLRRQKFDAVIADILMPRMDGYRLCQEIRRDENLRHLPIVVYTATYVTSADAQLAERTGADRYLVKPAPLAQLRATFKELLEDVPSRTREATAPDEQVVMREYNAVLIQKLEEKSSELETTNAELRRVNAALEESRARAAGIIASAMDAIITIDQHGDIVLCNAAAETMFRTTEAEMVGRPLDTLLPEHLRSASPGTSLPWETNTPAGRAVQSRQSFFGRRADGEEFPIEASRSRLEVAGRALETVILRDITERRRAEIQARLAAEQLRALATRVENVREQERTRIAREIHDVLAQELTRLKIDLVWLARRAAKPVDDPTRSLMATRLQDALAQADVAISTVQRIATELRPVILDSLGLPAAVEWQAEEFSRRTEILCRASTPGGNFNLERDRATALFRILQESLTNIARHAAATEVDIQLLADDQGVALIVRDNGRGIAPAQLADPLSIGLAGMRERAQAFGVSVEIAPAAAGGTVVTVHLPAEASHPPPSPP